MVLPSHEFMDYDGTRILTTVRPCATCDELLTYENGRLIDWDHQDGCPTRHAETEEG